MQDNISQCQEILSLFLPLDEVTIARIVDVIIRTQSDDKSVHSKLLADLCGNNTSEDLSQWDADTLTYATKQLAPELNWVTIMEDLDHEGFYIPNEAVFYFLMSVYKHASQILSPILDMIPYAFGVKLAALASCKGLIDLEKWLSSNLNAYKDAFYEECIKFLKEVHLAAQVVTSNHFCSPNALRIIYLGTSSTFLKVLQSHSCLVSSPHLSVEMDKLHVTYMGTKSRFKSSGSADLSSSDYYSDDIEAEANLYFHQLFSGQVTNDTMIRMLAHLKESTEKREQAIFRCMIVKLLTESFAKYPVRQLQMSAVLFGSLIKNQLVTNHILDIALQKVLDSLREPTDSKAHGSQSSAADGYYANDIEAEATLHFQQMFSGQLTSDAVIQMLAQFKGSTDNREYKIYAMYPEKQLKIAAAFLESLTKNKLITHPTVWKICNQALRAVLDELHEMSVPGTVKFDRRT
ncbi:hypothetical protein KY289_004422 [Solanum tuberosum]|nr:hypothetical protein KY289_004422 [Solanum tuberosum]